MSMFTTNQFFIHQVTSIAIEAQHVKGEFWETDVTIRTTDGALFSLSLFSSREDQPIAILCDHEPDGNSQLNDDEIEKLLDEKAKRINPESLCDYCLEPLAEDGHCSRCEADPEAPFWPEAATQTVEDDRFPSE